MSKPNIMYLFNNEADTKDICHVCLQKGEMSEEHIPPKKAYNESPKLFETFLFNTKNNHDRRIKSPNGFKRRVLCKNCNCSIGSQYAKQYITFVSQLVDSPKLFDSLGSSRLVSLRINSLFVAKEIAMMILALEPLSFGQRHSDLRKFILDSKMKIKPPFKVYGFLVPLESAGTIVAFHSRVSTFAPGYKFTGGEISWFPFGFVYSAQILDKNYQPEKLTDITGWFQGENPPFVSLFCRDTCIDSIQHNLGSKSRLPQINCNL